MNITVIFNGSLSRLDDEKFNKSNEIIPYNQRPETYVVPVLFFLIFVVGVIGNGTLVVIFIRHKNMRNVPNMYIISLALADLLVILTSVPFTSIIYTMDSWPWGETICKISEFGKDVSTGVSVFTLTALSADRFFAIVDPLKKFHTAGGGNRATRITLSIALSIWMLATLLAIPAAVASHLRSFPENGTETDEPPLFVVCYPFKNGWLGGYYARLMVAGKFVVLYLLPLVVIAVFYLGMATTLVTSAKNLPGEKRGLHKQIKARKKVAVTVLVFVAVFAVCFAPIHAFMLFFYFDPNSEENYDAFWHYLRIVGFCLCYMNSCANPIALYFISATFRNYFNRYLLCRKWKRVPSYRSQRATSISMVSIKRNQLVMANRKSQSINNRFQETTVMLMGMSGNDNVCDEI